MGKINIIGNTNPEIGIPHQYSIFKAFEISAVQSPAFGAQEEMAHWEIFVLERGSWRKTAGNAKIGDKVEYNFNQKSLTRKGIRIVVTKGNDKAELIVKTKPAKNPKINKIELLDINGKKVITPLSYEDTLVAKAYCTDMEGESLHFTLWEDDALKEGHNKINEVNKINPIPQRAVVKKGIARVSFNMAKYTLASRIANMQIAKGDKDEGKTHEYYVTAEYYGKWEASNNANLKNPEYQAHTKAEQRKAPAINQPRKSTSTKPDVEPKQPNKKPAVQAPAPKKETPKYPVGNAKTKATDKSGKIISVEIRDKNKNQIRQNPKYGEGLFVLIKTKDLLNTKYRLNVWEDDTIGKNDLLYSNIHTINSTEQWVYVSLTKQMQQAGEIGTDASNPDKGEYAFEFTDHQELFVEIEFSDISMRSSVVNVDANAKYRVPETSRSVAVVKGGKKEENKDNKCPNCEKVITADDLKSIFPDADVRKRQNVANTYNKYMKDLSMNTCWNKAHFFAQARVEAGLGLNMKKGENFNYYYAGLSIFEAFQTREGKEKAILWGRPSIHPRLPGVSEENQIKIANYAYSPPAKKARELENTEPNDGWNYRGRGLIQVTGKGFYKYCNKYTKKEGNDILANPNLIGEKIELAVLTSMVFFEWKGINKIANRTKDVKGKICPKVGKDVEVAGGSNYNEKQKAFNEITSKVFKIDECIWGKIVDVPVSSSDGSVLEEMKKLVDLHIPYSQSGVRNELTEEGLENLDCSETVGIYLHKLGVMPIYKAIDTSTMTTEINFRKTIGTNNIDLISGSDQIDFKPKRGDVFVWRKGAAGPGHTGIVYKYDENTDIVTILEAIGKVGAVSEKEQVKNGGYARAGCSRTAKYSRLKGALYGHKGWAGYFRPKNYTRKL